MECKRVVSKKHKRTQDRRAGTFRIGQAQPTLELTRLLPLNWNTYSTAMADSSNLWKSANC